MRLYPVVVFAIFMLSTSVSWSRNEALVVNEAMASQFFPMAFIDTQGFHGDSLWQFDEPQEIEPVVIPAFPIYSQSFGVAQSFVGLVVPAKFLGLVEVGANTVLIEGGKNSRVLQAERMIRNMGLVPYFRNNRLYGLKKGIQVRSGSSSCIGLCFSSSGGGDSIFIGDIESWGLDIDYNPASTLVGKISGLNFASGINAGFSVLNGSYQGASASKLMEASFKFTQMIQNQIIENSLSQVETSEKDPRFIVVPFREMTVVEDTLASLQFLVEKTDYSSEFQSLDKDLQENIDEEVKFKEKVEGYIGSNLVTNNLKDHEMIQSMCDHLSAGFNIPQEIWPKCRIQGTLSPNAFAYPGGNIFISAGLLGILSHADSAAFVLGHEIGHVFARHGSHRMSKVQGVMFAAQGLALLNMGFATTGGAGTLGNVTYLNWWPKMMAASLAGGKASEFALFPFLAGFMAYGREQEWQADRLGHEVSFAAGADQKYIHRGWNEFTSFLEQYTVLPQGVKEALMASHPKGSDRAQEIQVRYGSIYNRLAKYHNKNQFPKEIYQSYDEVHKAYKPAVIKWGEEKKQKRESRAKSQKSELNINDAFAISSLFGPGSRCIHYALGGVKESHVFWKSESEIFDLISTENKSFIKNSSSDQDKSNENWDPLHWDY